MSRRMRMADDHVVRRPETKSFILTSEFWVAAGAAAAVFLGGYALDDIAQTTAWRYGTWIAIAYIISRGIAKAGSQRAYQPEPLADRSGEGFWRDGDRDADRRGRREDLDLRDDAASTNRRTEPSEVVGQSGEPTQAYDGNRG
jgi:hypothetical protein